jgi:hypothetical protein
VPGENFFVIVGGVAGNGAVTGFEALVDRARRD